MRRIWVLVVLLAAAFSIVACGEKDQATPQPVKTAAEDKRPDYWPQPNPFKYLSEETLDTLRAHKQLHNITRDEYWGGATGGVLANDYLEVWYPEGRMAVTHGMFVFDQLRPARARLQAFLGEVPDERVVIRCARDMEWYKRHTPKDWWHYSHIEGDTLVYQPVFVLVKRGLAQVAIPHEYYQWALNKMTGGRLPRWMEEGIASYLSLEKTVLENQLSEFPDHAGPMSPDQIERILATELDRRDSRIAYYRAYRMVERLVETSGEESVARLVRAVSAGYTLDQACRDVLGTGYQETLDLASQYTM